LTRASDYDKIEGGSERESRDDVETEGAELLKEKQQQQQQPAELLPFASAVEKALATPKFELASGALVIASIFVVAFQTLDLKDDVLQRTDQVENLVCLYFLVEYLARWYSVGFNPTYLFKPLNIIDLLSFTPLILTTMMLNMNYDEGLNPTETIAEAAGPLTILRLLRVLRLQRYLVDFETFRDLEMALGLQPSQVRPYQLQFARVILSLCTLFFTSAGLIYLTESGVNPDIPNFFAALYFGLTTLTTVGFGDIAPVTPEGKLVVCLSIILGVSIIPVQLTGLAEAFMAAQADPGAMAGGVNARGMRGMRGGRRSGGAGIAETYTPCRSCKVAPHRLDAQFCWRCGAELRRDDDG